MFDLDDRSMTLRCYLGDDESEQRRSAPLTIRLEGSEVTTSAS
jgi:hypothetical protein